MADRTDYIDFFKDDLVRLKKEMDEKPLSWAQKYKIIKEYVLDNLIEINVKKYELDGGEYLYSQDYIAFTLDEKKYCNAPYSFLKFDVNTFNFIEFDLSVNDADVDEWGRAFSSLHSQINVTTSTNFLKVESGGKTSVILFDKVSLKMKEISRIGEQRSNVLETVMSTRPSHFLHGGIDFSNEETEKILERYANSVSYLIANLNNNFRKLQRKPRSYLTKNAILLSINRLTSYAQVFKKVGYKQKITYGFFNHFYNFSKEVSMLNNENKNKYAKLMCLLFNMDDLDGVSRDDNKKTIEELKNMIGINEVLDSLF